MTLRSPRCAECKTIFPNNTDGPHGSILPQIFNFPLPLRIRRVPCKQGIVDAQDLPIRAAPVSGPTST
jgi:hypothetical protein